MKKRFIEWDMPLAEISEASAIEANIRVGHPATLHKWWARRPLASSRATNFSALIDLPDEEQQRKDLIELIKKLSLWESIKNDNDKNINHAKQLIRAQWGDQRPKIIDPFAGGGTIPLEALRLGCETHANDYNPVAVFIEMATCEWPQKYGIQISHPDKKPGIDGEIEKVNFLIYMVEKWAHKISQVVEDEIGEFYPKEPDGSIPVGYIWAKTIPCQNPGCGAEIPLVRQFWLAKNAKKKIAYKPIINKEKNRVDFKIVEGNKIDFDPGERTVSKADVKCLICGQITKADLTHKLAKGGKMGKRLILIVFHHPNKRGKTYRIADKADLEVIKKAEKSLEKKIQNWPWLDNPIPDEKIAPIGTYGIDAQRYTINEEWGELFNIRQKLALITFMEKIKMQLNDIKSECRRVLVNVDIDPEEAAKVVFGYLALMFSRFLNRMSLQATWYIQGEKIQPTFSRQALPTVWDSVEINPHNQSSGSWESNIYDFKNCIESFSFNNPFITCTNHSATSLPFPDNYFDAVFTDPPYYDNVPYSDLSDYYYVWIKRVASDMFPILFSTPLTPKSEEAIAESMRQKDPEKFFEDMLSMSFKEIHRILKKDGITTIVYAHKTTAGWETMLNSLVNAGLVVTASWPLHTEMKTRLRAAASAALASSIYMVCRKSDRKKVGFYSELQPKIEERIEIKLQQFWNEGIAGGDFFISAIGPGMEIFSQFERVEKFDGKLVKTNELLDYIRSVSRDFIVRKLLKGATSTDIDKVANFYLAYRWTYLDNTVKYDDARKLASASGINLDELWGSGGFIKKSGSKISVLGPKDRGEVDSIKSMVDVMHKCLLLWEKDKKEEIAELLAQTGLRDDPAFKQFCQAVAECLLNGNKEKQLLEGFLMGIDNYAKVKVKIPKSQTDLKQFGGRVK